MKLHDKAFLALIGILIIAVIVLSILLRATQGDYHDSQGEIAAYRTELENRGESIHELTAEIKRRNTRIAELSQQLAETTERMEAEIRSTTERIAGGVGKLRDYNNGFTEATDGLRESITDLERYLGEGPGG